MVRRTSAADLPTAPESGHRRMVTPEHARMEDGRAHRAHWNRWGPFLSERAWGTVREDYSATGSAWEYFPHDHARSRAFRWNEDGLCGICDRHQRICFALALWNGRDPILKERLFGLNGNEGNHSEDVKEQYFYLDSTPTHSYMKCLYKYPQAEFPYSDLLHENRRRTRQDPEYELLDTGVFAENRYFDVFVEYAKAAPEDILIRVEICNRGPESATLHVLPTIWFRNRWSWGYTEERPEMRRFGSNGIEIDEPYYGRRLLYAQGNPDLLFTENESNAPLLWGYGSPGYFKDGIGECVMHGNRAAVNPAGRGTKGSAHYQLTVEAGQSVSLELRLTTHETEEPFGAEFEQTLRDRADEANDFYATVTPRELTVDARAVMRQAFAGMLWSKQYYHYVVRDWLNGDPHQPPPPPERRLGRNHQWTHLYNSDVVSMPDKWEYPWYAAWDLAFHWWIRNTLRISSC
jgi:hypothetical protein